ncbi:MAG: preprotein translocase subunit YajC [Pseudomonadota bacterium]
MIVSPAYAQTAGDAGAAGGLLGIVPFILMFVIFYFFLIRPQQRRMKEHRKMIENLRKGDQVITAGGLYGKVTRILEEDDCEVQIAEGVKIKLVKSTISAVVSKTEPAAGS